MEWWVVLVGIFGAVFAILAVGMPVAFTFMLVTLASIAIFQGGTGGYQQYILSIYSSVSKFTLLPIPLFVLMGEILWHSRIAANAVEALDRLLGRLPGRLSLLTVMSGTVFSSLSGSTMANTAMLGTMMLPEMHKRGYAPVMSMGPIMASGALAMLIPPSALAVIFAAVAKVSIGKLLLALIVPGLLLATGYCIFIVIGAWLRPDLAPDYDVRAAAPREQVLGIVKHLLPLTIIVFLVVGVIFLGVATPTEAAALGCIGSFSLGAAYGSLSFEGVRKAVMGTVRISVMMVTIMVAAIGFSQILAYTGASRGLLEFVVAQTKSPIVLMLQMQAVLLFLGCFMEQIAIMMITLPIFMPIILTLNIDTIWFAVLMLINLEIALMTPPFGLLLFVLKGVVPPEIKMLNIYASVVPYIIVNLIVIGIVLAWPDLVLYLPSNL